MEKLNLNFEKSIIENIRNKKISPKFPKSDPAGDVNLIKKIISPNRRTDRRTYGYMQNYSKINFPFLSHFEMSRKLSMDDYYYEARPI